MQMYAFGIYPGSDGLCKSGMTMVSQFMPDCGPVKYPKMLRWLRA